MDSKSAIVKRVALFPFRLAWSIVGWAWGLCLDIWYWVIDMISDLITG